MKTDVKNLPRTILTFLHTVSKYAPVMFTVIVLGMYSYLILHVSSLTQVEVDQTKVLEQLETAKRSQLDQRAVDRILLLQDQNVQVESLFEEARDNPFSE